MRRIFSLLLLSMALATAVVSAGAPAWAAPKSGGIEVVEVKGTIDGSVERAVLKTIEKSEKDGTALVVLQIDSPGVVDANRTRRMISAVSRAKVDIATWVGPPGAKAENGAARIVEAARIRAISPGSSLGPVWTLDLRRTTPLPVPTEVDRRVDRSILDRRLSADAARKADLVRFIAPSLDELLTELNDADAVSIDLDTAVIRFHKLDIWGRLLHAAAQPSIAYLFLLLALVGIVFELFHPSNGPAGICGVIALALSVFGMVTLGGSWLGFALIVAGVVGFCVDLRYEAIGLFTFFGFGALVAGSLLLFPGPYLRVSPWVLAFGIVSMTMFMLGAMTRVLRDLRAIARGELEVQDAHPHPTNGAVDGA